MLVRFVVARFGLELISYESPDIPLNINPDLLSGMLQAMESIGVELNNPIQEITFSNWVIYIRPYSDYTIRLILTDHISKEIADDIFEKLSKKVDEHFPDIQKGKVVPPEIVQMDFLPSLKSVIIDRIPHIETSERNLEGSTQRGFSRATKIAVAGLGAVGKTSIKNLFLNHVSPSEAANTKPTLGVDICKKDLDFLDGQLAIQEFGGQTYLRARYVENKSMWLGIAALVFVVDLQRPDNFVESFNYLKSIWAIIKEGNQQLPVLSIFLHKYDPSKRKEIAPLLKTCLETFSEFQQISTYHLTALEDRSSNTAIVKTVYSSLPTTLLENLLQENFYKDFESNLLPRFIPLITNDAIIVDEDVLSEIRSSAILSGRAHGAELQKAWISYLSGELIEQEKQHHSTSIQIKKAGKEFYVTIKKHPSYPNLSKIVLDGLLTGITKSLQFSIPKITEESPENITWQFGV